MANEWHTGVVVKDEAAEARVAFYEAETLHSFGDYRRALVLNKTTASYHTVVLVENEVSVVRRLDNVRVVVPEERRRQAHLVFPISGWIVPHVGVMSLSLIRF